MEGAFPTVAVNVTSAPAQAGFVPPVWAMEMVGKVPPGAETLQVPQQYGSRIVAWVILMRRFVKLEVVMVQLLPTGKVSELAQLS